MAMQYKNQFQSSTPPSGLRSIDAVRRAQRDSRNTEFSRSRSNEKIPTSLDAVRRQLRAEKGNFNLKIQKIRGTAIPVSKGIGFWSFNTPSGGESVDYTFSFSGSLRVLDFGDGTRDNTVTSGVSQTKNY